MAQRRRPPVKGMPPPRAQRPHRRWFAFAAAGLLLAAGVSLWLRSAVPPSSTPATRPNVLLITLDTTRADRIGSYGYRGASTPHLDRLAAAGVRFDRALSPAPLTLPAHASLMTGREPYAHGVRNNGYFVLPEDASTLAESFTAAGYDTAAFVSAFVVERQAGLAQGFAHYDDALDRADMEMSLDVERRGDRTVAAAARWLGSRTANKPFFVWVHLFDPHEPYAPPSPFRERFVDRPYDGEVAFTDAAVGNLLDAARYDGGATTVIVAGDHGESLGDHGESTHGLFVYDAALRVPLIMAGPGVPAGTVVTDTVRLIDVAPTISDLANLGEIAGAAGRSLQTLMAGGNSIDEPPPVYAETYFPQFFMGWSPLRSLRVRNWKFIDAPDPELYDLSWDPEERTNLVAREPARAESLRRALRDTLAAHANSMNPRPLSDDARQRLASLGYVSTARTPGKLSEGHGADPKRMVDLFEQLREGNLALARGDAAAAATIARDAVRQDPANGFARLLEGRAALALDRNGEAITAFTEYLRLVPQSADAHHLLAVAALRLGDRHRALAEEDAALALDNRHTGAIALRAGLLLSLGRADEGVASLRDALARDPSNRTLMVELADLLADARQFNESEAEYRRVLAAEPSNGRALTGLGVVLAATGRLEAAIDPLNRAVELQPRDDESRFARAEVLAGLGRRDEARAEFAHLSRTAVRPDLRDAALRAMRGGQ